MRPVKSITEFEKSKKNGTYEAYQMAREYLVHENALIGQRMGWFISFNSFLFASLSILSNAPTNGIFSSLELHAFALFLAIAGVTLARATYVSVEAANDAMKAVKEHWVFHYEPSIDQPSKPEGKFEKLRYDPKRIFPYVKGGGPNNDNAERGRNVARWMILILGVSWSCIVLWGIWSVVTTVVPMLRF